MDKKHHFRRQYRFTSVTLDRRRRVSTSEIAKKVNQDKDAMSKKMPGIKHRLCNHGIGSNVKYLGEYGIRGWIAGVQHDLDDIRHTLGREDKTKGETVMELWGIAKERRKRKGPLYRII